MTQILKKLANKLNKISESFMNSNFIKAWEQAAINRAEYYIRRNTIKELQALSDRELYDVGITRGQIYDIANRVYKNN